MNNILARLDDRLDERCLTNSLANLVLGHDICRKLCIIPESPAISTLSLPIFFPRSVNGLRLGILMLGMMSCGVTPWVPNTLSFSSSSLDTIAWLAPSSVISSSEFLYERTDDDWGLLGSGEL